MKKGDKVLDVGCGSGILSIATLLLGADSAVGVDIDETAVRTAAENAEHHKTQSRRQIKLFHQTPIVSQSDASKAFLFHAASASL